jgi:hypothetical protein
MEREAVLDAYFDDITVEKSRNRRIRVEYDRRQAAALGSKSDSRLVLSTRILIF